MGAQQSIYSPLDPTTHEIRVLHIHPGVWHDLIICSLHTVSLDSSPFYETLSYTWGDPLPVKPILLSLCVVGVRENLWNALRRLRCADKTRVIWIDALCINQENYEERAQQVGLMGRTYGECCEVKMWLGDGLEEFPVMGDQLNMEEGSKVQRDEYVNEARWEVWDAFCIILLLGTGLGTGDTHVQSWPCFRYFIFRDPKRGANSRMKLRFERAWKILDAMMKLPYWSRIWVVQESILPPCATLVLGSISMPFLLFAEAEESMGKHEQCCQLSDLRPDVLLILVLLNKNIEFTTRLRRVRSLEYPHTCGLEVLLLSFFHRKATDPRDKLYGLLSLTENSDSEMSIVVDYTPENTPRALYRRLTTDCIQATNNLEILMGQCRRRIDVGFPSWIVDWGLTPDELIWQGEGMRLQTYKQYHAAQDVSMTARHVVNERLVVRGMIVDVVAESRHCVMPAMWNESYPTLERVLSMDGADRRPSDKYIADGTWAEAYQRAMSGDLIGDQTEGTLYEFRRATKDERRVAEVFSTTYVPGAMPTLLEKDVLHRIATTMTAVVMNRAVFVTKQGYLGCGPEELEAGDLIHIIAGSNVPFALRRATINPSVEEYRLVGDCYVQGIMDGEACEAGWQQKSRELILC